MPRAPAALLAAALRAQSEGVFVAERGRSSRGFRIVFVNDRFCALTGFRAEELIGQPHGVLQGDPGDTDRVRRWLRQSREQEPLSGEGSLARNDGTRVSVAWSYGPVVDSSGKVTHIVASFRDLTENRRLHESLVHAQRLDAVGRLAGGVAHDFNNLLSVINGYCEMLAVHVAANPQALREVAEIHQAGRKAAALTQQLLAFSRRQPFDFRIINLNTLIRANAPIIERLLGRAGELQLELAPDLANVRTDPAQFQQVVLNLATNARDALQPDGRIVVSTANRTMVAGENPGSNGLEPGRYVVLKVSDNGTGMTPETREHLFEPFFTTKAEGKGTGLGLALVYGVVQQSRGTISVHSEPSVGSTFEIVLPAVSAPVDEVPIMITPLPSLRGTERVVLIEEDDVVRQMVAGILTADGYHVTAAKTLLQWKREARSRQAVQLLITSLSTESEKALRRLLKANRDLRLLCTGPHDLKVPLGWLPEKHHCCIQKPFVLSELVRAARSLLDA